MLSFGYFDKEELTDEVPKLLEFPVPKIGSFGYPTRDIDKRENEYGTMIHSKGDIDAMKSYKLESMLDEEDDDFQFDAPTNKPGEEFSIDGVTYYYDDNGDLHATDPSQLKGKEEVIVNNLKYKVGEDGQLTLEPEPEKEEEENENWEHHSYDDDIDESLDVSVSSNLTTSLKVANTVGASSKGETVEITVNCTADEFLEAAATVHGRMENSQWSYCNGLTTHSKAGSNGHGTHTRYSTQEQAIAGNKTVDCSTFVSWVLQEAEIVPKGKIWNSHGFINEPAFAPYLLTREEAGEPEPGDILLMDTKGENGHAQINGVDNVQYNCGNNYDIQHAPYVNRSFIDQNSKGHFYEYIIRLFSSEKEHDEYVGYNGNDAVVSPVTGILLEYGTYTDNDIDSVTQDPYRVNVDLKYGPLIETETFEPQIISDRVGYAKILVLDRENYQTIESELLSGASDTFKKEVEDVGGSLLSENGKYQSLNSLAQSDYKDVSKRISKIWNDYDKTLYGYKEFAESYEIGGIAGNIIYIDGFMPELPDDSFDNTRDLSKKIPYENSSSRSEKQFTLEESSSGISFKSVKTSDLSKDSKTKQLESIYFADEKHKFASEKESNRYKAETKLKEVAYTSVYFQNSKASTGDDLVILKEGTIIGRTMTDKELIEGNNPQGEKIRETTMQYKPDGNTLTDVTYDIARPKKQGEVPLIIGNYLRIIMRDTDKTPVENVEDYMKLDPNKLKDLGDIEKLMTWQALEPEGFHYYSIPGINNGKEHKVFQDGHQCIRIDASDFYGYDWVMCNGGNNDPNLCPGIFMGWPGKHDKYSGGVIFHEVTGIPYSQYSVYNTWCTGEQLLEIYKQELESEVEGIKRQIEKFGGDGDAIIEQLNQDQINALIDVAYKGIHYMTGEATLNADGTHGPYTYKCQAHLIEKVAQGKFNEVTVDDFVDTNKNHPRRRIADYLMFSEGTYMSDVNNTGTVAERFIYKNIASEYWNTCYEFISETPFQDLMRMVQPVEEVPWTGSYKYPSF